MQTRQTAGEKWQLLYVASTHYHYTTQRDGGVDKAAADLAARGPKTYRIQFFFFGMVCGFLTEGNMIYLIAIGLAPGGSSTLLHTNNTYNNTIDTQQYMEQHNSLDPCTWYGSDFADNYKGPPTGFLRCCTEIIQLETGIKIVAAIFIMCFAIYPLVTLNVPVIGLLCKSVEGNSAANRMAGIGPEWTVFDSCKKPRVFWVHHAQTVTSTHQQLFSAEVNTSKHEIIVNNIKILFILHSEHTASSLQGTSY
jgi:hypothetical protein